MVPLVNLDMSITIYRLVYITLNVVMMNINSSSFSVFTYTMDECG